MPVGPTITWEIPVALFAHVALATLVIVARCSSSAEEPLFKPQDTIQVALAGPPKNVTRMPQKAERAPDAPKAAMADPTAPTPPPNPSDMAFKTPDAPKTKGDPNADARQKAIDDLRRRAALDNLSAPVGKEDRLASNPDGSEDAGDEATSGIHDPALAKWQAAVKRSVEGNWHPLLATCQANPNLEVLVAVKVDAGGNPVEPPKVVQSSGNHSLDESARRAVESTGRLPAPPAGYNVTATNRFKCKEVL